ncbi:MAG: hypothetical protein WBM86_17630 [Waterburya sp.]
MAIAHFIESQADILSLCLDTVDKKFQGKVKTEDPSKGSRISIDGKPAIVAREIRKGDRILVLRDENGIPMWRRGQS